MINFKDLIKDFETIKEKLLLRKVSATELDECKSLFEKLKNIQTEKVALNTDRNRLIQENAKENATKIRGIKDQISIISAQEKSTEEHLQALLHTLPNLPDDSLTDSSKVVKSWGEKSRFSFSPLSHWELGEKNNFFKLSLGAQISGSGFVVYTGKGAKLFRVLIDYTLDENEKKGYQQYFLPVIINQNTLFGTAQLPKFEEDLFKLEESKYLSPTSETQLVNLYKNKIIEEAELPLKLTANTNCFRREAGGAGADTRGIIRLHQFNKTEIVVFCKPEDSFKWLDNMVEDVCDLLSQLKLPYQVVQLAYDDMGFAATKTYDIEVWFPSENRYREISSISNTLDFQARRAKIRYKKGLLDSNEKAKYPHILNASALAIDRLFAAILENYQQPDGSIEIPEKLKKYLNI